MNKPKVVISACLNGVACRYDGTTIKEKEVDDLKKKFELIPVCPEVSAGLGVPRKTIKLVKTEEKIEVIQSETNLNVTQKLEDFSCSFLTGLEEIDGFILKARSPSCGVKSTKVFDSIGGKIISRKEDGVFTRTVRKKFPYLPLIDEEELKNPEKHWEFLTRVFLLYHFRLARKDIKSLIEFHSRAKYFFLSLSPKQLKILGNILAQHKKGAFQETVRLYQQQLQTILTLPLKRSNLVNSFSHMFGYISPHLSQKDKKQFLKLLSEYQTRKINFIPIIEFLRQQSRRFHLPYLLQQFLLFPEK